MSEVDRERGSVNHKDVVCEVCSFKFKLTSRFRGDCVLCARCRSEGLIRVGFCVENQRIIAWARVSTNPTSTNIPTTQAPLKAQVTMAQFGDDAAKYAQVVVEFGNQYIQLCQVEHGQSLSIFQLFRDWAFTLRPLQIGKSTDTSHVCLVESVVPKSLRGMNEFLEFRTKLVVSVNKEGKVVNLPLRFFQ